MRTNRSIRLTIALIATLLAAACARHREEMSPEALLQKRDAELVQRMDRMNDSIGKLVEHVDAQLKAIRSRVPRWTCWCCRVAATGARSARAT
jgi:hypothetical protein